MNHINNVSIDEGSTAEPSTSWLFSMEQLENTPSRRAGISEKEESKQRRESIMMLRNIGTELNLKVPQTMATTSVYFHRFYMFHSLTEYPPRIGLLGCLFLAGKVEETPKKCKDILAAAQTRFPDVYAKDTIQDIMNFEKVLLHTLRFDLQVDHPYTYIPEYMKIFQFDVEIKNYIGTVAWTFTNDSYSTNLCLMWEPEVIAIAFIQMAINIGIEQKRLKEIKYANQAEFGKWWLHFVKDLNPAVIDVIEQVLHEFYT